MQKPNLSNCVDTVMRIRDGSVVDYLNQLKLDIAPAIRSLEKEGAICWYSFLVHDRFSAGRLDLPDSFDGPILHFRLSLHDNVDRDQFIAGLPAPFEHPLPVTLGEIGGLDGLMLDEDWAAAWLVVGESSAWILKMLEAHSVNQSMSIQQALQFLHFITNGLGIGSKSRFIPTDQCY